VVHLITGGAGFISVELTGRLLAAGSSVLCVDDLSRGRLELLAPYRDHPRFAFVQANCADYEALLEAVRAPHAAEPITDAWHMAANSDIPAGVADPRVDLKDTFMTTFTLLRVMKDLSIPNCRFASSSAIYGDLGQKLIDEDIGPLQPISNYGAMKLASEVQIRAAVEAFLPRADIFRFPNVIGAPATHGVILDFIRRLKDDRSRLVVLGDGSQRKPYLHVAELVDAMLFIARTAKAAYNVFNIGPDDEGVTVRHIAETVRDRVAQGADIEYGDEPRGWVGDVPRFAYSSARLRELGWAPKFSSADALREAVDQIARQEGFD
jgi:UDP-glucose 4-epimerase